MISNDQFLYSFCSSRYNCFSLNSCDLFFKSSSSFVQDSIPNAVGFKSYEKINPDLEKYVMWGESGRENTWAVNNTI